MPWGGKKGKKGKSARAAAKMTSARFKSILSERHLARFIAELELSDHDVYGFFELFCLIDKDSSGSIELDEFFDYLDLDYSAFAHRAFASMDVHRSVGAVHLLHFQEFIVGVINYCTLTHDTLVKFTFDILDRDGSGKLTTAHVRELVDMIYGKTVDAQVKRLLARVDRDHDDNIGIEEFRQIEKKARMLLFPIFTLQHSMVSKLMTKRFWTRATDNRVRKLGSEDLIEWHFSQKMGRKLHRGAERSALCHCVVHDVEGAVVRDAPTAAGKVLSILPLGTNVKVFEQRHCEEGASAGTGLDSAGAGAGALDAGEGVALGVSWLRIDHTESQWIDAHTCEIVGGDEEPGAVRKESLDDVVALEHDRVEEREREVEQRRKARTEREGRAADEERHKMWLLSTDDEGRAFWYDADLLEVKYDKPDAPFTPAPQSCAHED